MSLKQGLMQLREYTRIKGMKFHQDDKGIIIPIYSFINQLVTSIKSFLNTQQYPYWYIYIVNQHWRDRSFPNIISTFIQYHIKESWQKLSITSLECHLLQSLLIINNKNKLKLYLKARKFIIQTASNSAMLDQILLNVQDAISVIHKIYSNQHIRKALAQGIKNIFMAFKLTQAKIYSSVFIQYLLTVYDSVFRIEHDQATISGNFSNYKSYENSSNYVELYSSISNFQSGMHDENGLYKKTNFTQNTPKKYQIIDRKFIPLKQTSQFVYYQNSNSYNNKSSLSTKKQFKYSPQKQKSSFYDFISHSTQQQNHQVSHQQSTIQQINSFSKSYQKQQQYFLQKQAIQKKRNENSLGNKENNNMKSYKISLQRQSRTQATKLIKKFSLNRQQTINNNNNNNETMSKNFSLNWFSKKVFETSGGGNDDQKQSVLRRQKQRMKRKVDQRKKLHITSADSTQQYQIENHLIGQNNNNMSQISNKHNYRQSISQQQWQSHNNKSNNSQQQQQQHHQQQQQYHHQQQSSQAESVKKQQFQIMVSKNQQFKWKMLKKNYPSNSNTSNNSQYTMNSQHIDDNLQQHQKQQQQQQNDDDYDGEQFDSNQQQISGHSNRNNNSNDNSNGYNPEFMMANSTFSRVKRQLQLQQSDEGQSMSMSRGNFSYNISNNKNKNINNNQQPKQHQHQSMLKRDTLYHQYQQLINNAVSPQIMTVKQRADNNNNKSKAVANNNNNDNNHNDVIMSMSKNSINNNKTNSIQKYPNFIKKTYSKNQQQQQNNEQQQDQSYKQHQQHQKPQIIHKSINKSQVNNFSNNNNKTTLQKHLLQSQQQQQQQSNSEYDHRQSQQSQYSQQKSSFDINKMKKMISIIDNYRNNNNNQKNKNKSHQQEQYQSSNINISASNCKKSNFHSSSIQKDYEEIQDYSFY